LAVCYFFRTANQKNYENIYFIGKKHFL